MKKHFLNHIAIAVFASLLHVLPVHSQTLGKPPVYGKKAMVVSAHYLASQIGRDVLKQGGNAVDAAVATAFALAVVHPAAGNIGGGGFMVLRLADGTTTTIDYREKAPLAAHAKMYLDENGELIKNLNHIGYLSVGVPGTVAGLTLALEKYGSMPLAKVMKPAIKLAEDGFLVSYGLSRQFNYYAGRFRKFPSTAQTFLKADSSAYQFNERFVQKDLSRTLKRIAKKGAGGFYSGETADLIVKDMQKNGGLITNEDLAQYKAIEREPVEFTYRGYTIYSMAPPSSGGVTLGLMLNILEGYDLAAIGQNSASYLHLLVESMRRGFENRAKYLGDPDFNPDMPLTKLLSKEYAAELRRNINSDSSSVSDPADIRQIPEGSETTHFSVVDEAGNVVSNTFTLENSYGSKAVVAGAGFFLNDEMGDFNPRPGYTDTTGLIGTAPNLIEPGKRMLSSMTPTIVTKNGRTVLAIGSPGGRTIINTVLQVILNVIDFDMNVFAAIDAPRIHHQWLPDVVRVERWGIWADTIERLRNMGHKVDVYSSTQGRAMGIQIDDERGVRMGGADPRSPDGAAIGY